jgi:hypothetical protein
MGYNITFIISNSAVANTAPPLTILINKYVDEAVKFWICIRDVFGPNLSCGTGLS